MEHALSSDWRVSSGLYQVCNYKGTAGTASKAEGCGELGKCTQHSSQLSESFRRALVGWSLHRSLGMLSLPRGYAQFGL